MDLSKYNVPEAAQRGAFLHLRNPFDQSLLYEKATDSEGNKKPFGMRVLGKDAKSVQEALRKANEQLAEGKITEEEHGFIVMASSITGWSDEMEMYGKHLPYSQENAIRLLSDPATEWVGEQLLPFSLSRRNFGKNVGDV